MKKWCLTIFFVNSIIYTPPNYSDHVAVSLLLDSFFQKDFVKNSKIDRKDAETKKSQPHMTQKSISDFFTAKTIKSKTNEVKIYTKRKSSISDYFSKPMKKARDVSGNETNR